MLAPRTLPPEYVAWNLEHRAPSGPTWWSSLLDSKIFGKFAHPPAPGRLAWRYRMNLPRALMRGIGPFGFQSNSRSRMFEYPWCFFATPLSAGMRVVEIGAGASGLQFVLALRGLDVTSVDPLVNPSETVDWVFSADDFERLNRAFGARVRFVQDYLERAALDRDSYDRVFSISAFEHIPAEAARSLMHEVRRVLRPGGSFVATIDLFLDCQPFSSASRNKYGSNISVRNLVEDSGLVLKIGTTSELHGYSEFDPNEIWRRRYEFLVVRDVMTQCLVLEKPV
jgi:SAM-dependent methyltransferase